MKAWQGLVARPPLTFSPPFFHRGSHRGRGRAATRYFQYLGYSGTARHHAVPPLGILELTVGDTVLELAEVRHFIMKTLVQFTEIYAVTTFARHFLGHNTKMVFLEETPLQNFTVLSKSKISGVRKWYQLIGFT